MKDAITIKLEICGGEWDGLTGKFEGTKCDLSKVKFLEMGGKRFRVTNMDVQKLHCVLIPAE